jgi:transposase-like protein
MMKPVSYKGHRFPMDVIREAVWLYFLSTISLRNVEDLLAERCIDGSYETICMWTLKFGAGITSELRRRRAAPTGR